MPDSSRRPEDLLRTLEERAKELNCLYRVEEILHQDRLNREALLRAVTEALPGGWQYPSHCQPRIRYRGLDIHPDGFQETPWEMHAPIELHGQPAGQVSVYYTQRFPDADEGPFLKEERRLLSTIAARVGQTLLHRELTRVFAETRDVGAEARRDWRVILDVLRRTDQQLYRRIARKMLNRLTRSGIAEASALLASLSGGLGGEGAEPGDENRPLRRPVLREADAVATETFRIAADHLSEDELLAMLQAWLQEDRVHFLILALESTHTSLAEISSAVERFQHTGMHGSDLPEPVHLGLKVSLVRRLLSDNLDLVDACRRNVDVDDFFGLLSHVIQLPHSHGRLGGKSSGLFLATQILKRAARDNPLLRDINVPKTWYLPSDGILHFIAHNDLDDVYTWKYLDPDQVRQEYPNLVQVFKNSRFPAEFVQGLSSALDDFGERPLIVRSSSLLEDRAGSAFSGKYKSLFLANQGDKAARLEALLDAIAEVYASVFGADPIQYRAERGLLDHHEEMGIMIQEVVGTRVGRYFLPSWAGVGLSQNEFRWSPRIRREDGLLRLVPGLGTRAVDRLADDYPVLAAPGQPQLRVNVSPEDVARYSPRRVDLIDLERNAFETVDRDVLLREVGGKYPGLGRLVSIYDGDRIRPPQAFEIDTPGAALVFTFDGLLSDPDFVARMRALLSVLSDALGWPVDLEFASDGTAFHLLQCRQQSHAPDAAPAAIPRDVPPEDVVFTARRYVSNGTITNITHVVYVDSEAYARLPDREQMRAVGEAVGRLNKLLPKRQFILMGPGRWGSRGDIRLGVNTTYADINNTAALIEVARRKGQYVPDVSFGTHYFQDLVESSIRYLPLYPDDDDVIFNEAFLMRSPNMLAKLLPSHARLTEVIHVIDVPGATGGRMLQILMNADLDEAVGLLGDPEATGGAPRPVAIRPTPATEDHSRWRLAMAQQIALQIDVARFGVRAAYVFGSTKNATAQPESDIDLLLHVDGTPAQRQDLASWLEGWSLCLAEINYLRTGHRSDGLLDVHLVTDDDLARRTSYAAKIDAPTDAARRLPLPGED